MCTKCEVRKGKKKKKMQGGNKVLKFKSAGI